MSTNPIAHRRGSLLRVLLGVMLAAACDSAPVPTSPTGGTLAPTPYRPPLQLRPRRPSTQRRPCPSISRRAERSTYWAGTPGPAHPRHQRSNSAGTPRSANTRCSHRGTPIGAASRPCRIFDLAARHISTTSSGAAEQNSRFSCCVAPPHRPPADGYVGNARICESSSARAYFAFGIATEPGDVPVSGTMTCSFGEDEIGEGGLTFDRAAGTVSGWAEPFWGGGVRYQLVQTSFAPGATTFAATFGTDGVLEGRFFGPRAVNVAVRAKGGGQGFAAVSGIMTGVCEG